MRHNKLMLTALIATSLAFAACQKHETAQSGAASTQNTDALSTSETKTVVSEVVRDIKDHFRYDALTVPDKNFVSHKAISLSRNTDGSLASVTIESRLKAPWNYGADWANTICTTSYSVSNETEYALESLECEILED